jgi:uncharacterized membrane protein (DUF2068 family)
LKQSQSKKAIRLLSLFEACKGLLVLLAGAGLFTFFYKNAQQEAVEIVRIFHLNPARHYPEIFINTLANLSNVHLWFLSISAILYSFIRFAEAYGLWNDRLWAIWFAIASSALFLPIELYELTESLTIVRAIVFLLNVLLVLFLLRQSRQRTSKE